MSDPIQRSRSVYIGNLPWDVKEDDLKKIFSQVGTIVSLRIPIEPESGKSRGFAFCEYREQESVHNAIRNLTGYELNGRKIRVDSALNNADKDVKGAVGPVTENPYGESCDPEKAPEIIASVIGSMSAQQIQSIISETKKCLQADPDEARTALLNSPQLVYALLLALVRGRYITKERGTEALAKPEPPMLPLFPEARPVGHPPGQIPPLIQPGLLNAPGASLLGPVPGLRNLPIPGMGLLGAPPGFVPPTSLAARMNPHAQFPSLPQVSSGRDFGPGTDIQGNLNDRQRNRDDLTGPTRGRGDRPSGPMRDRDRPTRNFPERPQRDRGDRVDRDRNDRDRTDRDRDRGDRTDRNDRSDRDERPKGRLGSREEGSRGRDNSSNIRPIPSQQDRGRDGGGSSRYRQRSSSPVVSPKALTPPPSSSSSSSREEQEKAELLMQVLRLKEEDIAKMQPEQQRTVRMLREQFKNIPK